MSSYILYRNDNGADVYCIDGDERSPEEIYQALIEDHDDDYFETDAYLLTTDGQGGISAEVLHIPEFDDADMLPVRDIGDFIREHEESQMTESEYAYSRCCDPGQLMNE